MGHTRFDKPLTLTTRNALMVLPLGSIAWLLHSGFVTFGRGTSSTSRTSSTSSASSTSSTLGVSASANANTGTGPRIADLLASLGRINASMSVVRHHVADNSAQPAEELYSYVARRNVPETN